MIREDIRDLTLSELDQRLTARGVPSFRARQIFEWLYRKGVGSFDEMRTLPESLRKDLAGLFTWTPVKVSAETRSGDGTRKFLLELADQEQVETVLIPTETRATVCVSTQAGCKFGCRFCASGVNGWRRHLTCAEILHEILYVRSQCRPRPLTHVVFMGTGEPLDNYDQVLKAVRIINAPEGLGIAARRITISTCGLIPQILRLAEEGLQIELAISLHGYDDESRRVLMPVNQKYPVKDLIAACRTYVARTNRQITFEYILIKDVTCTLAAAAALGRLFKGLLCKMNLIPYNPVDEFGHVPPSRQEMLAFRAALEKNGVHATVRMPRGQDAAAACGQLRLRHGEAAPAGRFQTPSEKRGSQ